MNNALLLSTASLLVVISTATADDRDAGGKTAAQWLEHLKSQPAEQTDARLADLRRGCMLEVTYRPMFKTRWDVDRKECLQRYRDWVAADGNARIDRWLHGETLSDDEQKVLPVLKATYMYRAWNRKTGGGPRKTKAPEAADGYVKQVVQRGEQALRDGFLDQRLTTHDVNALRDYLIYTAMRLTSARLLPFEVGASRGKHSPLIPGADAALLVSEKRATYGSSPSRVPHCIGEECCSPQRNLPANIPAYSSSLRLGAFA